MSEIPWEVTQKLQKFIKAMESSDR
jgi:hypothetical protein